METVKVYMVRKPSDFEEVKTLCKKYAHEAEEVLIEETVNLPPTWYEEFCQRPLDNYIFLIGKPNRNTRQKPNQRKHNKKHISRIGKPTPHPFFFRF